MTLARRDEDFDQAVADAFGMRMVAAVNAASLAVTTSVGHQLGLFDVLAGMTQGTSEDVAAAAGLQERYVREWLAQQMLADAGFTSIDVNHLDGDSLNTYYIARKDDSP